MSTKRTARGAAMAMVAMLILPGAPALAQTPPDCSLAVASPSSLDRGGELVAIDLSVPDTEGGDATVRIHGVRQDEPTSGLTPQDEGPDATLTGVSGLSLQAERDNKSDGRVYTISFEATNGYGTCSGTVTVEVRRWKMSRAVDSGPIYDSLS